MTQLGDALEPGPGPRVTCHHNLSQHGVSASAFPLSCSTSTLSAVPLDIIFLYLKQSLHPECPARFSPSSHGPLSSGPAADFPLRTAFPANDRSYKERISIRE